MQSPSETKVQEDTQATEKLPEQIQPSEIPVEAPTPRRRARVNYLELAGSSPARTPSRRGRSASIEGANNVQSTPKPPPRSARKLMAVIAEKTSPEKAESDAKKESEGENFIQFLLFILPKKSWVKI